MRDKRLFISAASLGTALVLGGCASSVLVVAPPVSPAMVTAAHGPSAESLNEGRRIFVGPCAACHAPDPIGKYSLSEWHTAIDEMAPRAKLSPDRRAALLAYVSAAKAVVQAPER